VGEPIRELLRGKLPEILAGGLSASLGAFITTAGAVSLFFGVLRPAGIIAGLIIVPLVTVFMFFALAALAGGMIFPPLLSPLGFILSALYNLLDRVVSFAALAPGFLVPYPLPVSVFSLGMAAALICLGNRLLTLRKRLAPFN
jgi:competence protein ComEC